MEEQSTGLLLVVQCNLFIFFYLFIYLFVYLFI